ncbi:hypothetical protein FRC04_003656 [Tulasnella sp. 424]|nr:hypothetical protein FRC04_003656 [Tulasnella sp. 424]KAG8976991.1 hypothetical protein FRC05_002510 [Tulasnella sp. 425]
MAPFQERFEVQVAPREVKMHANRLSGSCNDDDPDEEQLLDNAELIEELFLRHAQTSSVGEDIPFQLLAFMVQVMIVFFSWDRIPKLLDLLAEMDQIRREVSEKAKSRLLAYEVYMHEHPDDEEVLDDGERDILGWWTNPVTATDLRREYHHITLQLREHHVIRCLANRNPEEYERLQKLYFPQDYSISHELYHQDLSEVELEKERLRAEVIDIKDVWEEWEDDRTQWLKKHFPNISDELLYGNAEYLSYKDAFAKRFLHAKTIENVVRHQVRNWVRVVERHLEDLEGFGKTGGARQSSAAAHSAPTSLGGGARKKRRKTGSIASRSNQKKPRFSIGNSLPSSRRTSIIDVKKEPEES